MKAAGKQMQPLPKRIQRTRTKGSKLPPKTLCVTRPSLFSNPYPLKEFGVLSLPLFRNTLRGVWNPTTMNGESSAKAHYAYQLHAAWLKRFPGRHPLDVLRETVRKYDFLACWCPLESECHADILLELARK
jgi:Domain of unknown function (DUF4326)